MLELTKALSSVPEGKEALEKLNTLNERFRKRQLKTITESQRSAPPEDPRVQMEAYIDSIQRQRAELAIQVNNLHRLYTDLSRKCAPWKSRLEKERQRRVRYQEKRESWYQEYRMDRTIASDILAKADAPSMHLDHQDRLWDDVLPAPSAGVRVLVHCVIYSDKDVDLLLNCEKNIPYFHDLCLTSTGPDGHLLCEKLSGVEKIQSITVRQIQEPVSSLVSLLGIFGRTVSKHEIVLNLDFQQLVGKCESRPVLDSLCGTEKRVEQIFSLFQSDGNVGLFYVQDLRQKADPFDFTFEDCGDAERILAGWNVDSRDTIFSWPSLNCFFCRTQILRPVIGNRWFKQAEDTDEEEVSEEEKTRREEGDIEEDRKAYQALSKINPVFLSKIIGYLCDQKPYLQCVTAPGSEYFYGDVQKEVRSQFDWTDLSRIGLKKFDVVCFEIRDTLITDAGAGRYCARQDIQKLYRQLQNCGVTLFVYNDFGSPAEAESVLKGCGYENWDFFSDRAEQIPQNNACLICAHRVLQVGKSRNVLVIFSPERILAQMPSGRLESALDKNRDCKGIIVGEGICNAAMILSDHDTFRNISRRYAAALQCRGFIVAAEKKVPEDTVLLTIGEKGLFLQELWKQQTGRSAVYLPISEDFLNQASVRDEESFDGMLSRTYKGTLDQFLRESFGLKIRDPYGKIIMDLPRQSKEWQEVLHPVLATVLRQSEEEREQCRVMVEKTTPAADHYVLLTLRPSARIRYELSNFLNAPVDGVDFYQLQKMQRGSKHRRAYAKPYRFLNDMLVKPTLLGEDDGLRTAEAVDKKLRIEQELATASQKEQKKLLRTIKLLDNCRLDTIEEHNAVAGELLQMAGIGENE